jgi:hypothetical protein
MGASLLRQKRHCFEISEDYTMKNEFYSHSLSGKSPEDWHRLEDQDTLYRLNQPLWAN